jgi:hypothetical protein
MWVPQFMSGCGLSMSRVSKVEKIWSPSLSVKTHAPSMYSGHDDRDLRVQGEKKRTQAWRQKHYTTDVSLSPLIQRVFNTGLGHR